MARNLVPPDGVNNLTIGTKVKRWLKGFFAGLDVANGANAPVNTLQRSTTYAVGDVVQSDAVHAKYFLKCTTAGTTGSTDPDFTGVTSGSTVTDGTAVWTVQTFGSEEALDDYLPLSGGTLTGTLAGTNAEFSGDVTSDNVSASGSVSAAMADISNANKAPINTLQRDTEYAVGDVLYTSELHAKFFLKCTTAGTTDETAPDFTGVGSGDTVTDGTAEFTVQTILSLEEKEAAFVDDLIAALQTTGSLPTGTAFSAATLLSKMIANMNTEDGVQYNFNNANAWYICLGAKYGGLIIQGGTSEYITVSGNYFAWSNFTLPISITASRAVAVTSALGQFQKIVSSTGQLTSTTCRVLLNNLTTDAHSFSAYVIVISF